jgi:hypothetical protein
MFIRIKRTQELPTIGKNYISFYAPSKFSATR